MAQSDKSRSPGLQPRNKPTNPPRPATPPVRLHHKNEPNMNRNGTNSNPMKMCHTLFLSSVFYRLLVYLTSRLLPWKTKTKPKPDHLTLFLWRLLCTPRHNLSLLKNIPLGDLDNLAVGLFPSGTISAPREPPMQIFGTKTAPGEPVLKAKPSA